MIKLVCGCRRSTRSTRAFSSNTESRGAQRAARFAEALGRGRPHSPPPNPESPPPEPATERPESPTQPITTHLLEMGFTAPHIKKAVESLGKVDILY